MRHAVPRGKRLFNVLNAVVALGNNACAPAIAHHLTPLTDADDHSAHPFVTQTRECLLRLKKNGFIAPLPRAKRGYYIITAAGIKVLKEAAGTGVLPQINTFPPMDEFTSDVLELVATEPKTAYCLAIARNLTEKYGFKVPATRANNGLKRLLKREFISLDKNYGLCVYYTVTQAGVTALQEYKEAWA